MSLEKYFNQEIEQSQLHFDYTNTQLLDGTHGLRSRTALR
jgi:hypothetical protein